MKSKKRIFRIDEDLLGIVSFLVHGGNRSCQYGAGTWFLREVSEQIRPKDIAHHIITLAFDNIPMGVLESYCKFAVGKVSLTNETERFLRDRGFLYGEIPTVPRLVRRECKWRMKYIYEAF